MEVIEMTGESPVVARVSYDLYSPEYKRGMILEWANSGSSQKGFAREKGIPDTTFSGWVKKWRAAGCPGLEGEEADEEMVRTKSIYLEPMSIDAAITRMEALGHSFFLYLDDEDDQICVAYKRLDGGYGVIQAENKLK